MHTRILSGRFAALVLTMAIAGAAGAQQDAGSSDGTYGPGMMMGRGYGMGPGMMMGPGQGMGPGYGMGPGMMMGPGQGMGPGYGMGPGMMMGPGQGMGQGYGMGPGMMMGPGQGMGPGYGMGPCMMHGYGQPQADLQLTVDNVQAQVQWWVDMHRNPRLKVGEVTEKDADTIVADIATQDGSLVQRFLVDRHTGIYRIDYE